MSPEKYTSLGVTKCYAIPMRNPTQEINPRGYLYDSPPKCYGE